MQGLPEVAGVTHSRVRAGNIEMHVAEAGKGDPLLLVHGWPQHWYMWRKLIPELARDHRVICPDLRGLGWTDAPPDGYDKETLAEDLLNLLDAMGLRRVKLVGHDWGAWVAYLLALRAPERIERVVVLSNTTPGATRAKPNPMAPLYMSYQFVLAAPVVGQLVQRVSAHAIRAVINAGTHRDLGDVDVYAQRFRDGERARASTGYYRAFLLHDLPGSSRYAGRRPVMPLLKVIGEHDWIRRVVDAEWDVVIPDAGHFLPEEAPAAVLKALRPFLDGEETPPPRSARSRVRSR